MCHVMVTCIVVVTACILSAGVTVTCIIIVTATNLLFYFSWERDRKWKRRGEDVEGERSECVCLRAEL